MPPDQASEDIAAYAAAIRAEVAGLALAEREALLEDLEDHLAEVAAEAGAPLSERLGPPAAYAAELLAAYGAGSQARRAGRIRGTFRSLSRLAQGSAAYRSVRGFLPQLRPAWWVFRAYLAVLVLVVIVSPGRQIRPIPNPLSSRGLLQWIATGVAIVISVRLGSRLRPVSGPLRYLGLAANGLVAVVCLVALNSLGPGYSGAQIAYYGSGDPYYAYAEFYNGKPVTNIYPYSLDGRPLSDVLLYDQAGRPLTLGGKVGPVITQFPTAADGQPILNAYPLLQRNPDGSLVQAPRVALPPVAPSPIPSSTPSPTVRPSPSP
jgi:hypothetical protein